MLISGCWASSDIRYWPIDWDRSVKSITGKDFSKLLENMAGNWLGLKEAITFIQNPVILREFLYRCIVIRIWNWACSSISWKLPVLRKMSFERISIGRISFKNIKDVNPAFEWYSGLPKVSSICMASGFCRRRWIVRLSGRTPYTGSKPSRANNSLNSSRTSKIKIVT